MVTVTALARTGKTAKTWILGFALMMVVLGGSVALALDPMGPPASGLKRGQFRMGVDFSHSEMDLELVIVYW